MPIIICPFLLINFQRSGHPEISQDNSETNQHSQYISPPPKPCQGLQISVDSGPELSKLPPKASSAAEAHSDFEILACSSVSFGEVKCILSVNAIDTERQRERYGVAHIIFMERLMRQHSALREQSRTVDRHFNSIPR